jgi:hypothetical protein
MKKLFFITLYSLICLLLSAQQPANYNGFKWQAVLREGGSLVRTGTFTVQAAILQDTSGNGDWQAIYEETHDNIGISGFGQISLNIGSGNAAPDLLSFEKIPWGEKKHDLRIAMTRLDDGEVMNFDPSPILMPPFSGDNFWKKVNDNLFYEDGKVGIGNSNPTEKLVVGDDLGNVTGAPSSIVIGNKDRGAFSKLVIGENEDNWGSITWRNSATATPHTMLFGTSTNGNVRETFSLNRFGRVGIGTTSPSERLVLWKDLGDVTGANAAIVLGDDNPENISKIVFGEDENHWGGLYWSNSNTDRPNSFTFQIKNNPNGGPGDVVRIREDGVTEVEVLQINGGSDGAEYFNFNDSNKLPPGSLVIIDERNEGKLRLSSNAYDTRVAGIISGAGGVKPGIALKQEEVLEGDQLVSLWGRVFVKATADNGRIRPGDLLTSSHLPGHVMKATRKSKSKGAVIGKALSSLEEGEGLVLVLIQPQ